MVPHTHRNNRPRTGPKGLTRRAMQRRRAKEEIGTGTGCSVPSPTATSGPLTQSQLPPLRRPGLGLPRAQAAAYCTVLGVALGTVCLYCMYIHTYLTSGLLRYIMYCTCLRYFVQYIPYLILLPILRRRAASLFLLRNGSKTEEKAGTDITKVASRRPSSLPGFAPPTFCSKSDGCMVQRRKGREDR